MNAHRTPSTTAGVVVFFRACAHQEKDARFRGPDYLAKIFYPRYTHLLLKYPQLSLLPLKILLPGLYEYITARTAFFDSLFLQALEDNIPQIVLLGAGYDTRAYRFAKQIHHSTIFECDALATQAVKQHYLAKANIPIPKHLRFVPINFNQDDLDTLLVKANFDKYQKTLFIWEGVTMYLPPKTVNSILYFIKNNVFAESKVAFDYVYQSVLNSHSTYHGAARLIQAVKLLGEPYRFGIDEHKITPFLTTQGFDIISHYAPIDLQQNYLYTPDGKLFGRIAPYYGNVYASNKP